MRLSSGERTRGLKGHENYQSIAIKRLLRIELLSALPSYSGFSLMPHQRLSDSTATANTPWQTNSLHASRKLLREAASAPHRGCRLALAFYKSSMNNKSIIRRMTLARPATIPRASCAKGAKSEFYHLHQPAFVLVSSLQLR